MFELLKRKPLVTALDECQSKLKAQGFGFELTSSQYSLLTRLPVFNDIDSRFASHRLSSFGGLCWYLAQTIEKAITDFESSKKMSETDIDFTIKLATLALLISNSKPQLIQTNDDIEVIGRAKSGTKMG